MIPFNYYRSMLSFTLSLPPFIHYISYNTVLYCAIMDVTWINAQYILNGMRLNTKISSNTKRKHCVQAIKLFQKPIFHSVV